MIRFIVICVLFMVSSFANARTAPISKYKVLQIDRVTNMYFGLDKLTEASLNSVSVMNGVISDAKSGDVRYDFDSLKTATPHTFYYNRVCLKSAVTGGYCTVGSTSRYESTVDRIYICSDGSAPNQGYSFAQQCPDVPDTPAPCSDKNPMIRQFGYGPNPPYRAPDHVAECVVEVIEMLACHKMSATSTYCYWMVKRTGDVWSGTETPDVGNGAPNVPPALPDSKPPTTSPPVVPPVKPEMCKTCTPCPKGTSQAGIGSDGVPMCVGTGTNPPTPPVAPPTVTKPPTTTTGSDGTTVKTQQTEQTNSDGSKTTTTTTTTTKPDGSVSVSSSAVVSPATSGAAGKTDTQPSDDKYNLCKQNPTLSICRESSVSGTCGQISCVGDAIQCATLRAAALMQCQQQKDIDDLTASPQRAAGASILSGADPMKVDIESAIKGTEVDLSKPNLDQTGFLAGGSCFPNKTFMVMGKPVTMDFVDVCQNIQPLRNVILACSFIIAYLIVSRSALAA